MKLQNPAGQALPAPPSDAYANEDNYLHIWQPTLVRQWVNSLAPKIRAVQPEPKFQAAASAPPFKIFGSSCNHPNLLGLGLHRPAWSKVRRFGLCVLPYCVFVCSWPICFIPFCHYCAVLYVIQGYTAVFVWCPAATLFRLSMFCS